MEQENSHKSNSNLRILVLLLVCITVASVSVSVWTTFFRETTSTMLASDYIPVETETYAAPVEDESNGENMKSESAPGGGSISMAYRKTVTIALTKKTVKLMFQNPAKSVNDMVLQLVVVSSDGKETVIAQSGLIKPGNEITKMDLIDGAASMGEGSCKGRFHIFCYAHDSGEKAIVNGSVEGILITVTQ